MFSVLLILFIAVPVIEIALFIQVGGVLGGWATIALILLTAVVGASLVRNQGLKTLLSLQQRLKSGELPAGEILEGVLLLVAGALLLTPGFLTDFMGMFILFPPARVWLANKLIARLKIKASQSAGRQSGPFAAGRSNDQPTGNVFEGEFERKTEDKHHLK